MCTQFFLFMHRSREDFTEMTFTPKLSPLGMGDIKFTIPCLLTLQILRDKFGKDWLSSC